MKLPRLSIAAKLYAIFALMATTTMALAAVAVIKAHSHAALTDEFQSANTGSLNVERIGSLINAVVMEARGIYMSEDGAVRKKYADSLLGYSDQIGKVVGAWELTVRPKDMDQFEAFAGRVREFIGFYNEVARLGVEAGTAASREWGDSDASAASRMELRKDLGALNDLYMALARETYAKIDAGIEFTAIVMAVLGGLAIGLAVFGTVIIWRAVAQPLVAITRVTEAVAGGDTALAVPYGDRKDEIGALSRSIAVFQRVLRQNAELNHTISAEAEARGQRNETMSAEIASFNIDIEANLSELGRLFEQMLAASSQLAEAADQASTKTAGATAASSEASANVRDIASAADELAVSVTEIDRQVAQSNAIAEKAVGEAARTNAAVKELDEAAGRIDDVIKLITDIAEQTNLLALNATIEAARAGDAGRGFAVVAGEVKALSAQTAKATEDIGAQIAAMQGATKRSIQALAAIERTIREIGEISSAIATAVTEQGAATQEIARSVEIAARRTNDTAAEVVRVGEATENTRTSAASVKTLADDLAAATGNIRAQVEHFFKRLRAA
jgi:methyl-accepting chemotaxis protein